MSTTKDTINSYNEHASAYTKYVNSADNFWNKYLEVPAMAKLLENSVKNKDVLDLGCGSGVSTKNLVTWGANVVGIDISEKMIDIAKNDLPGIDFFVEDMEKTHFGDSAFDVVSSSLVLQYVHDLSPVFKESNRVLKNGGRFVFSMGHPIFGIRKKVFIDDKKEYILKPYFHNNLRKWSMFDTMEVETYQHTFSNITNKLIDAGFSIESVVETTPVPEGKTISPKDYDRTMKIPSFIIFDSTKNS